AFGVLPAVSLLQDEQIEYYFLSGFTAKLAGTERGINSPTPTFSACFGNTFLTLHPTTYSNILMKKIKEHNSRVYLVSTGWNGKHERISLTTTRKIINSIIDGTIRNSPTAVLPIFNLNMPTTLQGLNSTTLDPRSS